MKALAWILGLALLAAGGWGFAQYRAEQKCDEQLAQYLDLQQTIALSKAARAISANGDQNRENLDELIAINLERRQALFSNCPAQASALALSEQ